jgi:hypothetical protein
MIFNTMQKRPDIPVFHHPTSERSELRAVPGFLVGFDKDGYKGYHIFNDTNIRHLEDCGGRIFIDCHNEFGTAHTGYMLDCS